MYALNKLYKVTDKIAKDRSKRTIKVEDTNKNFLESDMYNKPIFMWRYWESIQLKG